ncbi:hypothetical protein PAPYR_3590 [Paratrimastix pyriformis]|uniref:Uncharacterized protein n=1 Tax=Paratrimastix pyriformis TaxID=342808 RepID=A0ABQ8UQ90_9EUKA|nr:hypothetical protein PAPYR_3590 [Paratrimastix pyriformis]
MSRCGARCAMPPTFIPSPAPGWQEALLGQLGDTCRRVEKLYCFTTESALEADVNALAHASEKCIPVRWHWGQITPAATDSVVTGGNQIPSEQNPFSACSSEMPQEQCGVLFIGHPTPGLQESVALCAWRAGGLFFYDVSTCLLEAYQPRAALGRHLARVEQAKQATNVALLVGSGGAPAMSFARQLCRHIRADQTGGEAAGAEDESRRMKAHVMAMTSGLAPERAANFPTIDLFVHITCPCCTIPADTAEYHAPVVSPWEFLEALRRRGEDSDEEAAVARGLAVTAHPLSTDFRAFCEPLPAASRT